MINHITIINNYKWTILLYFNFLIIIYLPYLLHDLLILLYLSPINNIGFSLILLI
jgi:hypothetical protein